MEDELKTLIIELLDAVADPGLLDLVYKVLALNLPSPPSGL